MSKQKVTQIVNYFNNYYYGMNKNNMVKDDVDDHLNGYYDIYLTMDNDYPLSLVFFQSLEYNLKITLEEIYCEGDILKLSFKKK